MERDDGDRIGPARRPDGGSATESAGVESTRAQHPRPVQITGMGEGGSRTMLIVIDTLNRCGYIDIDNAGMGGTRITTDDGSVLDIGVLDTDELIEREVPEAVEDPALADYILSNTIAPYEGSGGNPERVLRWFDNNPDLADWLVDQHTPDGDQKPAGTIVHIALLGGSGNAGSHRFCQDITDGKYLQASDDQRGPVNIVAVLPAFRHGDRPRKQLADEEGMPGTAFVNNVIPRLNDLNSHVQQGNINALTPVSNGLLTFQSHALSTLMSYEELRRILEPIRTNLDWSKFRRYFQQQGEMRDATKLMYANDALRKSVWPQYLGIIRPPDISLSIGWSNVDSADFESLFGHGVYAPGRCFLHEIDEIAELFPRDVPAGADFETALKGAAKYSAWTNAAAYRNDSVYRATTIAYSRSWDVTTASDYEIRESVAAELGINPHDVALSTIDGFTDETFPGEQAPEIAVWTYANIDDPLTPYAQHLSPDERAQLEDEHDIDIAARGS